MLRNHHQMRKLSMIAEEILNREDFLTEGNVNCEDPLISNQRNFAGRRGINFYYTHSLELTRRVIKHYQKANEFTMGLGAFNHTSYLGIEDCVLKRMRKLHVAPVMGGVVLNTSPNPAASATIGSFIAESVDQLYGAIDWNLMAALVGTDVGIHDQEEHNECDENEAHLGYQAICD